MTYCFHNLIVIYSAGGPLSSPRSIIWRQKFESKGIAAMLNVTTSPRMEKVLKRAAEIGRLHTGAPFVGTENVLRALIEDEGGIAARVLQELDVADRIAERLDEIMSSEGYRTPAPPPRTQQ
jgi:ATP-dependent Clp protease ATP-binding subunit ClpA